jgi:hypothetical protein
LLAAFRGCSVALRQTFLKQRAPMLDMADSGFG